MLIIQTDALCVAELQPGRAWASLCGQLVLIRICPSRYRLVDLAGCETIQALLGPSADRAAGAEIVAITSTLPRGLAAMAEHLRARRGRGRAAC